MKVQWVVGEENRVEQVSGVCVITTTRDVDTAAFGRQFRQCLDGRF
jgi:hypothetical protein